MNTHNRVGMHWSGILAMLIGVCNSTAGYCSGRIETVAITNDPAPDGNGFLFAVTPATTVLNNQGQVAFWGELILTDNGTDDDFGIFLGEVGQPLIQVAREMQSPPVGDGEFSLFNAAAFLNDAGEVAFKTRLQNTANLDGVYKFSGGTLTQIARSGDAAPDSDGVFDTLNPAAGINDAGDVAFGGKLSGTANINGVFLHSGGTLHQLARSGMTAPDGNGEYSSFTFFLPVFNESGEAVFAASLVNTSGGAGNDDRGNFVASPDGVRQVVRKGQLTPDPSREYELVFGGTPRMNASGAVLFGSAVTDPGGTGNDRGLYLKRSAGSAIEQLAFAGEVVPDGNGTYASFTPSHIRDDGAVGFVSSMQNTAGGANDNFGVYLAKDGQIVQQFREGDSLPDGDGNLLTDTVFWFQFNNANQTVLLAEATNTLSGMDETVLLLHGAGETIEAAREGGALAGSTIDSMFISTDSSVPSINDLGQLAFQATLANGRDGAFLFTPELHYRRTSAGNWDDADSWTVGLNPAHVHDVTIRPDAGLTVAGPAEDTTVRSLTVGAGISGMTTLELQGGAVATENGLTLEASGQITGAGVILGSIGGPNATDRIVPTAPLNRTSPLDVGSQTARVVSLGYANLGPHTSLDGGVIEAPSGIVLPAASLLDAAGNINGPVAAQFGSTQQATGNLTLGDPAHPAGFASDGELMVGANTVTIEDANEALLGSLTSLGESSSPGVLSAANGAVLEFGKSITGFGTVDTPDDSATPLTNNGAIAGNSGAEPITLSGYVRGVGTMDNVVITGTDAPGFSPATVNRGSVDYQGVLEIEIGGTTPGQSGHDQINHILGDGNAQLGGTLELVTINSFAPGFLDLYFIINADGSISGKFETVDDSGAPLGTSPKGSDMDWLVDYEHAGQVELIVGVRGDMDFDGDLDLDDVSPFVLGLTEAADYLAMFGHGASAAGDIDGDFDLDLDDVDDFVSLLTGPGVGSGGGVQRVPEPSAGLLGLLCLVAVIVRRERLL